MCIFCEPIPFKCNNLNFKRKNCYNSIISTHYTIILTHISEMLQDEDESIPNYYFHILFVLV
jgi:hypothetical protein